MKKINEEISKIKYLMNLLVEDTGNPKDWVVGDFYIRKFTKSELNLDSLILKVIEKNNNDLTMTLIEYNDELKIKSEEANETVSIDEMWDSDNGVLWEKSSQSKWDEVSKYSIVTKPSDTKVINTDNENSTDDINDVTTIENENCEGNCENGKGILILPNGTKYDGNFLNSKFEGKGTFYDDTNKVRIVGKFSNGELNGNGTISFDDGVKYMGQITSTGGLATINIKTLDNKDIKDVINYHYKKTNKPSEKKVEFKFTGEVYYLNELKTKIPILNSKIVAKKIVGDKETESFTVNTDKDGKFEMLLERGIYNFYVYSENNYFIPQESKQNKLYNNIDKNFILKRNKKVKDPNEGKEESLISVGTMTIFDSPKKIEKKLYKKSKTKEEYCVGFTEFYYKIVIDFNYLFSENPINQNNLNTSKNFIISCYNQFSTNYDAEVKEKIKTLTNLAGDIEIFEL